MEFYDSMVRLWLRLSASAPSRMISASFSGGDRPVLAVGGEKSFGPLQAVIMRHVATDVREAVVAGSGHWLMEERPTETWTSSADSLTLRHKSAFLLGSMSFLPSAILAPAVPMSRIFAQSC